MRALLIGDYEHREFAAARQWLSERTELTLAHSGIREDSDGLSDRTSNSSELNDVAPDLVIFAQSRPGQFPRTEVERIHTQAPLARLVALLGSWCEGETRSGQPWPGVQRVYWHEWLPRMSLLVAQAESRGPTAWSLPRTATSAEMLLAASPARFPRLRGLALVCARRRATYVALADACEAGGVSSVWFSPERPVAVHGATLAVWDSAGWGRFESQQLSAFTSHVAPAPVIALLDFPRLEECQQAHAAGAKVVMPKPFMLEDLLWRFDELLGASQIANATSEAA